MNFPLKLNKLLGQIYRLSDEEIEQAKIAAEQQANYIHPLKGATASKIRKTGEINLRIIEAVSQLKNLIGEHGKK